MGFSIRGLFLEMPKLYQLNSNTCSGASYFDDRVPVLAFGKYSSCSEIPRRHSHSYGDDLGHFSKRK